MTLSVFDKPSTVFNGDINMAFYESGDGPPIILVHGFPELAYSWRHQVVALAAAGYRVIAPDMRGYGRTDKPSQVTDYALSKLIGDLTGLMDALDIESALLAGHDWGALVTWQMALTDPQRMDGLINLNIPFFKRPPLNPLTLMRWKLGKEFYIINFQDSDEADRRFAADSKRFINTMMRRRKRPRRNAVAPTAKKSPLSLLAMLDANEPDGEPLLSETELNFYAAAFDSGGFTGPINWYRNWKLNWRASRGLKQRVKIPTLFVGATEEYVVSPRQVEAMRPYVDDLEIAWIEDCGHWTQQEQPGALNHVMLDWMQRHYQKR